MRTALTLLDAIVWITTCSYWLVQRLFSQIAWVLEIIRLRTITAKVVETALASLASGP